MSGIAVSKGLRLLPIGYSLPPTPCLFPPAFRDGRTTKWNKSAVKTVQNPQKRPELASFDDFTIHLNGIRTLQENMVFEGGINQPVHTRRTSRASAAGYLSSDFKIRRSSSLSAAFSSSSGRLRSVFLSCCSRRQRRISR